MRSMSQTMLKDARLCEVKYKRVHINKEQVPGMESSAMYFGTSMHAALRAYLEGEDGVAAFQAMWAMWGDKPIDERFDFTELGRRAEVLLGKFEKYQLKKFGKPVKLEERLYGEIMGRPFEGTPDFVGEYEGKPSVIDFKTSAYPYAKGRAGISEQLYLYAHLACTKLAYDCTQLVYLVLVKGSAKVEPSISTQIAPWYAEQSSKILLAALEQSRRMEESERGLRAFMPNLDSCIQGERRCPFFEKCHPLVVDQKGLTLAA